MPHVPSIRVSDERPKLRFECDGPFVLLLLRPATSVGCAHLWIFVASSYRVNEIAQWIALEINGKTPVRSDKWCNMLGFQVTDDGDVQLPH
jgi:hypothetical protein